MRTSALFAGVLAATLCLYPQSTPGKDARGDARGGEPQGMPPRAMPADYQAHAQAGAVTVAAEFIGHFVPTPQGTLTTEDFVTVETGLFGEPGARIKLSLEDFSLRINGKKTPLPSQPHGLVAGSLKDPDWEPPTPPSSKSKTSIGGGGGGGGQNEPGSPPPVVHVPIALQRAMAEHTQKASLAQGDRALPQAGLIFFPYRGNSKGIRTIELIYNGPAGQATLALQP